MIGNNEIKRSQIIMLAQAYKDVWEDYQRSLKKEVFPLWDYVFLTASNYHQAKMYEYQLEIRKNYLPHKTKYIVIPDRNEERIGSGGATLSVLKYIRENEKSFDDLKILVIHSGGDSKRIPQYSALGKLFSPFPRVLPDGRSSTLFDELMIMTSSIPSRITEGMLLMSGDVMLLFNPLLIEFNGNGAASLSFKESFEKGKNHGVFVEKDGFVKSFLHKQNPEVLENEGAVDDKDQVNIDTGAVIFGKDLLNSLWSLISANNEFDKQKYNYFVNREVCLSLYGDFLYPLADDSSLSSFYQEKAENELNAALKEARDKIWEVLSPFRLKLLSFTVSKFIHFGTSKEIRKLMCEDIDVYKELGWTKTINSSICNCAAYNSLISDNTHIKENVYLESSYIHEGVTIGENSIISFTEVEENRIIPADVVIHCLKQLNGKYVCRIYGIEDNPKENRLFGVDIKEKLWDARLYPECETMSEAVDYALKLYEYVSEGRIKEIEKWNNRKSLCSGFNDADPVAIIEWNNYLNELIEINRVEEAIDERIPVSELQIRMNKLTDQQLEWFNQRLDKVSLYKKMRFCYYLGTILEDENVVNRSFKYLSDDILKETLNGLQTKEDIRIRKDEIKISLPLRVNWGGGWSDTPPYCIENGGTVLNAAILLNEEKPVSVVLRKIKEKKIIFESRDMGVYGEFDSISDLQAVGDPFDPFVLQKAALLACGIIPKEGSDLETVINRLGGGFYMNTEVTNVPKGSGLGTSSILAAACVKALFEFFGVDYCKKDLFSHVLAMEQLMSTGGGWQDQVGGVVNGIKLISSKPGIKQELNVDYLKLDEDTLNELNERFVLIYTGQRRLARNLLRDVVGRYIGNEKDTVYALKEIQNKAIEMKEELEKGNIDRFAYLLAEHWNLSKMIDEGSSNLLIDQIFDSIDDFIDGKMVCGAGGGGFLQVVLKKDVDKDTLHYRLKECYPDSEIDVWDCRIV